jgi:hypothetical protein
MDKTLKAILDEREHLRRKLRTARRRIRKLQADLAERQNHPTYGWLNGTYWYSIDGIPPSKSDKAESKNGAD